MIDWGDFTIRTPQQRLEEAKRVLGVKSMDEFQQEAVKLNQRLEYLFQKYIVSRRNIDLKALSTDALLDRFEEICLVESELQHSMFEEGVKKYNECQHALWDVRDQLKARAPDARRMLSRLYGHYNHHVRLKAAKLSYRVAPGPARRVLEELVTMKPLDEAFDAEVCLSMIDDGTSMLD